MEAVAAEAHDAQDSPFYPSAFEDIVAQPLDDVAHNSDCTVWWHIWGKFRPRGLVGDPVVADLARSECEALVKRARKEVHALLQTECLDRKTVAWALLQPMLPSLQEKVKVDDGLECTAQDVLTWLKVEAYAYGVGAISPARFWRKPIIIKGLLDTSNVGISEMRKVHIRLSKAFRQQAVGCGAIEHLSNQILVRYIGKSTSRAPNGQQVLAEEDAAARDARNRESARSLSRLQLSPVLKIVLAHLLIARRIADVASLLNDVSAEAWGKELPTLQHLRKAVAKDSFQDFLLDISEQMEKLGGATPAPVVGSSGRPANNKRHIRAHLLEEGGIKERRASSTDHRMGQTQRRGRCVVCCRFCYPGREKDGTKHFYRSGFSVRTGCYQCAPLYRGGQHLQDNPMIFACNKVRIPGQSKTCFEILHTGEFPELGCLRNEKHMTRPSHEVEMGEAKAEGSEAPKDAAAKPLNLKPQSRSISNTSNSGPVDISSRNGVSEPSRVVVPVPIPEATSATAENTATAAATLVAAASTPTSHSTNVEPSKHTAPV